MKNVLDVDKFVFQKQNWDEGFWVWPDSDRTKPCRHCMWESSFDRRSFCNKGREPTWLRFEDIDRDTPDMGSVKIHPNPPSCVTKLHAASTKHWGSLGRAMDWLDLLVISEREEGPCIVEHFANRKKLPWQPR